MSADFSFAKLAAADFAGASLHMAKFQDSDVTGASFLGAHGIKHADFADAIGMSSARFP